MAREKFVKYINIYTPAEKCIECRMKKKEGRRFTHKEIGIYLICTPCMKKMKYLADGVE